MRLSTNLIRVFRIVCILSSVESAQAVVVRWEPANLEVNSRTTFSLNLVADLPEPVLGWGLDVNVTAPSVVESVQFTRASRWASATAGDGDGLVGLAFPDAISGSGVLLATLTFSAANLGETTVMPSFTPNDPMEGFPLDPTGFAEVTFEAAHVRVVPEPSVAVMAAVGLVVALKRRARAII